MKYSLICLFICSYFTSGCVSTKTAAVSQDSSTHPLGPEDPQHAMFVKDHTLTTLLARPKQSDSLVNLNPEYEDYLEINFTFKKDFKYLRNKAAEGNSYKFRGPITVSFNDQKEVKKTLGIGEFQIAHKRYQSGNVSSLAYTVYASANTIKELIESSQQESTSSIAGGIDFLQPISKKMPEKWKQTGLAVSDAIDKLTVQEPEPTAYKFYFSGGYATERYKNGSVDNVGAQNFAEIKFLKD